MHYIDNYLLNPTHKVSVTLIGVGGTGSQVLSGLARMHLAMVKLGHPGLHVIAYDADIVSEANVGRQLFSPSDLGFNKAILLISRINRFYGLSWEAIPVNYTKKYVSANHISPSNILITCVDTAKARLEISKIYTDSMTVFHNSFYKPFYWMDYGNSHSTGQVILGTVRPIQQPKSVNKLYETLPTVTDMFPDLINADDDVQQGPSCSLAEALSKQDLLINSTLAQFGIALLWKMFREVRISYHGAFINLSTFMVNPIRLQ
ncbi:PRTRC system ThiF family protein [Xanthocytophaga flava]|uniref:PRTRC system ThiF family protein n=1 Tax=Xanthocytophaga flava TaxID=3048013 RepID=UPI0028D78746|nr:PRTRC system ThiF family protein [Xanthocytophaga flavus]MDJ1470215.1 PRTRC system ThiF family protein [Xanthocytophaga flavus]